MDAQDAVKKAVAMETTTTATRAPRTSITATLTASVAIATRMNDFWYHEGEQQGYLRGWHDRREFERRLLDAFEQQSGLSDGQKFLLARLREDMLVPEEGFSDDV